MNRQAPVYTAAASVIPVLQSPINTEVVEEDKVTKLAEIVTKAS
ncbi:MAG: hypothetical protein OCC46_00820 [Pseudodesulfovibrio sp.]